MKTVVIEIERSAVLRWNYCTLQGKKPPSKYTLKQKWDKIVNKDIYKFGRCDKKETPIAYKYTHYVTVA